MFYIWILQALPTDAESPSFSGWNAVLYGVEFMRNKTAKYKLLQTAEPQS